MNTKIQKCYIAQAYGSTFGEVKLKTLGNSYPQYRSNELRGRSGAGKVTTGGPKFEPP